MRFRHGIAALVIGLVALACEPGTIALANPVPLTPIALVGQSIPDLPGAGTFSSATGDGLSPTGVAEIFTGLEGPGINPNGNFTLWRYPSPAAGLQMIARSNVTTAPDGSLFTNIAHFDETPSGAMTLYANTASGLIGSSGLGIYTTAWNPTGQLQHVMNEGQVVTSLDDGSNSVKFQAIQDEAVTGLAGDIGYIAQISGGPVVLNSNDRTIWYGSHTNATSTLLGRGGDPLPASFVPLPGQSTVWNNGFSSMQMNGSGQMIFTSTTGLTSNTGIQSLWSSSNGAAPTKLLMAGDAVQNDPNGRIFANFNDASLNSAGTIAISAVTATSTSSGQAIYTGSNGSNFVPRVQANQSAPGYAGSVHFSQALAQTITRDGAVEFFATVAGSGITSTNSSGYWMLPPGTNIPQRIVMANDPAPGLTGVKIQRLADVPSIASNDSVYFFSILTGTGVTTSNDEAMWKWSASKGLTLLLRQGDLVDVGGGDLRTVSDMRFFDGNTTQQEGKLGSIMSDDGKIILNLQLSGGMSGTFFLNVDVPEPTCAMILFAVIPAMLRPRRRDRH